MHQLAYATYHPDSFTLLDSRRPAAVPSVRQACTDLGAWTQAGQLPLVYSETYNIRCFGLERCAVCCSVPAVLLPWQSCCLCVQHAAPDTLAAAAGSTLSTALNSQRLCKAWLTRALSAGTRSAAAGLPEFGISISLRRPWHNLAARFCALLQFCLHARTSGRAVERKPTGLCAGSLWSRARRVERRCWMCTRQSTWTGCMAPSARSPRCEMMNRSSAAELFLF